MDNVYEAAIIGVGAHWCQYLAINYKVYFSQNTFKNVLKTNVIYLLIFIVLYSIIMSVTGYKMNFYSNDMSLLVMIPLSGQLLHYYLDAFIWKFSDNHIRENIGKKLFA